MKRTTKISYIVLVAMETALIVLATAHSRYTIALGYGLLWTDGILSLVFADHDYINALKKEFQKINIDVDQYDFWTNIALICILGAILLNILNDMLGLVIAYAIVIATLMMVSKKRGGI